MTIGTRVQPAGQKIGLKGTIIEIYARGLVEVLWDRGGSNLEHVQDLQVVET